MAPRDAPRRTHRAAARCGIVLLAAAVAAAVAAALLEHGVALSTLQSAGARHPGWVPRSSLGSQGLTRAEKGLRVARAQAARALYPVQPTPNQVRLAKDLALVSGLEIPEGLESDLTIFQEFLKRARKHEPPPYNMVQRAVSYANRTGIEMPEEAAFSKKVCMEFISKGGWRPGTKELKMAQKYAKTAGVEVPSMAKTSKFWLARFMDECRDGRVRGPHGPAALAEHDDEEEEEEEEKDDMDWLA